MRQTLLRRRGAAVKLRLDFAEPPPALAGRIHRRVREATGHPDPYREIKRRYNRIALERLPSLRARIEASRKGIFFLLRAKCTTVSGLLGVPLGSWVVKGDY